MNKQIIVFSTMMLLGCKYMTPNYCWVADRKAALPVFFKCLEKIPKGPEKTKYNDWDEVIEECKFAAFAFTRKNICDEKK
ncbi:MAG: hypothetical protein GY861_18810 [bacterium]|nr:hypothetical protein [bacterium]